MIHHRAGSTLRRLALLLPATILLLGEAPLREAHARQSTPAADPTPVDWRVLGQLNYRTGAMTDAVRGLAGREVRVPGFMVPLEDDADGVTEFLLVPYFGACIHTPPPPPNQIVYVKLAKKAQADMFSPIWVIGKLKVENTESYYGTVSYQLAGTAIEPYEYERQ